MKNVEVCFYASAVAAIAGRHPHRTRGQALFDCIQNQLNKEFSEIQRRIRQDPELSSKIRQREKEQFLARCPSVQEAVRKSGNTCMSKIRKDIVSIQETCKSNAVELQNCAQAVQRSQESVVSEAMKQKRNAQLHETQARDLQREHRKVQKYSVRFSVHSFKEISKRYHAHCKRENLKAAAALAGENAIAAKQRVALLDSVSRGQTSSALAASQLTRQAISEEKCAETAENIKADSDGKIQESITNITASVRGTFMEAQIVKKEIPLDRINSEHRQKPSYLKGNGYVICGRSDVEFKDGRIQEIKTRKALKPHAPPDYDILQLQVYLKMRGVPEGDLLEYDQNDVTKKRITPVRQLSNEEWDVLDAALKKAANEIRSATIDKVRSWLAAPVALGLLDF